MPKPPTYPTIYDELKIISISFLRKHGYLIANQWKSGTVTWSLNGNETGSISIRVNTDTENSYFELDYKCNDNLINYRVQLVSIPSNLGKGYIWYFICPHTGTRCRKLHLAGNYFYHRSAFRGGMYKRQTQTKKYRQLDKIFGEYFQIDELFEQLYKKHFKKQYAGKPTKKYLHITEKIQKVDSKPYHEFERLMLS